MPPVVTARREGILKTPTQGKREQKLDGAPKRVGRVRFVEIDNLTPLHLARVASTREDTFTAIGSTASSAYEDPITYRNRGKGVRFDPVGRTRDSYASRRANFAPSKVADVVAAVNAARARRDVADNQEQSSSHAPQRPSSPHPSWRNQRFGPLSSSPTPQEGIIRAPNPRNLLRRVDGNAAFRRLLKEAAQDIPVDATMPLIPGSVRRSGPRKYNRKAKDSESKLPDSEEFSSRVSSRDKPSIPISPISRPSTRPTVTEPLPSRPSFKMSPTPNPFARPIITESSSPQPLKNSSSPGPSITRRFSKKPPGLRPEDENETLKGDAITDSCADDDILSIAISKLGIKSSDKSLTTSSATPEFSAQDQDAPTPIVLPILPPVLPPPISLPTAPPVPTLVPPSKGPSVSSAPSLSGEGAMTVDEPVPVYSETSSGSKSIPEVPTPVVQPQPIPLVNTRTASVVKPTPSVFRQASQPVSVPPSVPLFAAAAKPFGTQQGSKQKKDPQPLECFEANARTDFDNGATPQQVSSAGNTRSSPRVSDDRPAAQPAMSSPAHNPANVFGVHNTPQTHSGSAAAVPLTNISLYKQTLVTQAHSYAALQSAPIVQQQPQVQSTGVAWFDHALRLSHEPASDRTAKPLSTVTRPSPEKQLAPWQPATELTTIESSSSATFYKRLYDAGAGRTAVKSPLPVKVTLLHGSSWDSRNTKPDATASPKRRPMISPHGLNTSCHQASSRMSRSHTSRASVQKSLAKSITNNSRAALDAHPYIKKIVAEFEQMQPPPYHDLRPLLPPSNPSVPAPQMLSASISRSGYSSSTSYMERSASYQAIQRSPVQSPPPQESTHRASVRSPPLPAEDIATTAATASSPAPRKAVHRSSTIADESFVREMFGDLDGSDSDYSDLESDDECSSPTDASDTLDTTEYELDADGMPVRKTDSLAALEQACSAMGYVLGRAVGALAGLIF